MLWKARDMASFPPGKLARFKKIFIWVAKRRHPLPSANLAVDVAVCNLCSSVRNADSTAKLHRQLAVDVAIDLAVRNLLQHMQFCTKC